jgi:hypothetical protein
MYQDANTLLRLCGRTGQNMGLDRGPSDYAYSQWIFDMRRRFWKHLKVPNAPAMMAFGCEPWLPAASSRPPRNAAEENWTATLIAKPSLTPEQVSGFTNMSIAIVRGLLGNLTREAITNLRPNVTSEDFRKNKAKILQMNVRIEGS